MSLLNKLLPPPLTNPFFGTPGQAIDAVTAPIRETYGIPGSYQYVEQALKKVFGGQEPASAPKRAIGTQGTLGGKPVYWTGKSWEGLTGGGTSATLNTLNVPGTQSRFIQDSAETPETFGAAYSPSERAYIEEKNRATQLAEQDQLAKKYKVADLTKAYNTAASPEEKEKIGLQIWATTNPRLAARLKPGQLGYTEAQTAAQSQGPLGVINQAVGNIQYAEKVGFGIPSPIGATAFALETPLTKVPVPPTTKAGVTEAFTKVSPNVTEAFKGDVFKPDLSQTQLALLKQAFERGLK